MISQARIPQLALAAGWLGCLLLPDARADWGATLSTTVSATSATAAVHLYNHGAPAGPGVGPSEGAAPAGPDPLWLVIDLDGDGIFRPGALTGLAYDGTVEDLQARMIDADDLVIRSGVNSLAAGRTSQNFTGLPPSAQTGGTGLNQGGGVPKTSCTILFDDKDLTNGGSFGFVTNVVAANIPEGLGNAVLRIVENVYADAYTFTVGGGGDVAPSITTQPGSLTVVVGSPAQFAVVATGTLPLSYQWKKDNVDIPGATSAQYSIASTVEGDAGSYTVFISNTAGDTTSDPAMLVVQVPPAITTPPASQTVKVGELAAFSVVATGTPPLTYVWLKDGVAIAGAPNAATFTIASAALTDAGRYAVIVSNPVNTVTSPEAILTVEPGTDGVVISNPALAVQDGTYTFAFGFSTQSGKSYQVQSIADLAAAPAGWTNAGGVIAGTGEPATFSEVVGTGGALAGPVEYYRVQEL